MVAGTENVFHLFAHQRGTDRQAAAESFGGGNDVGGNTVIHVRIQSTRTAVTRLHLVHDQRNIVFRCQFGGARHEFMAERDHTALALHTFDHDRRGGQFFYHFGERFQILGRHVREAGGQRIKQFVKMILTRGRERRQRSAVETVFERDNSGVFRTFFLGGIFSRDLDRALVGFRTGIREKHFFHTGAFAKQLC